MVARVYNQADRQNRQERESKTLTPIAKAAALAQPSLDRDRLIIREVALKEAAHAALALVLADKVVSHPALQPYQVIVNLTALLTDSFEEIIKGKYKPDAINTGVIENGNVKKPSRQESK
jgi:hypothetical protein